MCSLLLAFTVLFGSAPTWAASAADFMRDANSGSTAAQHCLGVRNEKGEGVDMAEAARWYRKAAEQGSAVAQYCLGWCYYAGEGVVADQTEAVRWYRKAAEQGDAHARQALDRLERETKPTVNFCGGCGTRAKPGNRFCTNCGRKLDPTP